MDTFDVVIITVYFSILAILSFYGLHRYIMVCLFHRFRKTPPSAKTGLRNCRA
jgi:hypothetical protein